MSSMRRMFGLTLATVALIGISLTGGDAVRAARSARSGHKAPVQSVHLVEERPPLGGGPIQAVYTPIPVRASTEGPVAFRPPLFNPPLRFRPAVSTVYFAVGPCQRDNGDMDDGEYANNIRNETYLSYFNVNSRVDVKVDPSNIVITRSGDIFHARINNVDALNLPEGANIYVKGYIKSSFFSSTGHRDGYDFDTFRDYP